MARGSWGWGCREGCPELEAAGELGSQLDSEE